MSAPLLLLPLDDRPITAAYPPLLAAVAGEQVLLPPLDLLGHFLTPGNGPALADWLAASAPACRAAVVSLDMLAYGGLIASRTPATAAGEALRRLEALRAMKVRNPALRIYGFNVIMRLTITGTDAETRAAWRDIFRYSVLRDRAERLGDDAAARELVEVIASIPPRLLQAYLEARARNHAVNRAAIDLLSDGVLDALTLVQEDTAEAGLHVTEQEALRERIRDRAAGREWRLYPGTDEAALTLLAHCLLREAGLELPAAVHLRDALAAEHPARFEDLPLRQTVARHLEAVGGREAETGLPVGVHTFEPPQPDFFELPPLASPDWETVLRVFPSSPLQSWLAALGGHDMAIADVAYCNGGDPHLLDALLADGRYWALEGYAGWNTAGNTLGTVFAHAALRRVAQARGVTTAMAAAHDRALLIRLLDDGLYQPVVRAGLMRRAEESGYAPLNLTAAAPAVEAWVDAALQALWRELRDRYPLPVTAPFRARLPWGRLFEVEFVFKESHD